MVEPDFYMSSRENDGGWEHVRKCWRGQRLAGLRGGEYLSITVDLPTPPTKGNVPSLDLIISPHVSGTSLFPVSKWPFPVYVYRVLRPDALKKGTIDSSDVLMVAWCEIYNSFESANATAHR